MVKKYNYKVGYLIDVVSKNPADYTKYVKVEAYGEAKAVKEAAKKQITPSATSTLQWIDELEGSAQAIKLQLLAIRIVITTVEKIQ